MFESPLPKAKGEGRSLRVYSPKSPMPGLLWILKLILATAPYQAIGRSEHCSEMADGSYHVDKCDSTFHICDNGTGWIASCSSPLVFDVYYDACREKADVTQCNDGRLHALIALIS